MYKLFKWSIGFLSNMHQQNVTCRSIINNLYTCKVVIPTDMGITSYWCLWVEERLIHRWWLVVRQIFWRRNAHCCYLIGRLFTQLFIDRAGHGNASIIITWHITHQWNCISNKYTKDSQPINQSDDEGWTQETRHSSRELVARKRNSKSAKSTLG